MNIKELKRLAAACRKAGILHFKNSEYEFTLSEEAPVSAYKLTKEAKKPSKSVSESPNARFDTDTLTEEELMFWSVGKTSEITGAEEA